jgi:hypothetical protein
MRVGCARAFASGLLGLVVLAGACDGDGGVDAREASELPSVVFGGGGGTLDLRVTVDHPAHLTTAFEQFGDEAGSGARELSSRQALAPGEHRFAVDVAPATYGYFEVGIPEAPVGAHLAWTVALDGVEIQSVREELKQPLGEGYAFFLQLEFDDIAQLRESAGSAAAAANPMPSRAAVAGSGTIVTVAPGASERPKKSKAKSPSVAHAISNSPTPVASRTTVATSWFVGTRKAPNGMVS